APPPDSIQVESATVHSEVGSYLRSRPPKMLQTQPEAINGFTATTWSPATASPWRPSADMRQPQLAFSVDAQSMQQSAAAAPPAAAPMQPQTNAMQTTDLNSSELKELDDLDMLLITSDESFRPVTSQNPARPLTKIADGLPPNLSDVIFWPIGKEHSSIVAVVTLCDS
ncbi:hypothetical protein PMAYCL1PPCAC_07804, partial [Pristionchus mayeri]